MELSTGADMRIALPRILAAVAACMAALVLAASAIAQDEETDDEAASNHRSATVVVDGDSLYEVVGVSGLTSEQRAEMVARRIVEVAESGDEPVVLTIRDTEYGPGIHINGQRIDVVTPLEEQLEGFDEAAGLATFRGRLVVKVIEVYRERRTDEAIWRSVIYTLAYTVAFAVFCAALTILNRVFRRRADKRISSWVTMVEQKTGKLAETDVIVSVIRLTLWIIVILLFLIGFYYYLSTVLLSFPASRSLAKDLLGFLSRPLIDLAFGAVAQIPSLLALAVIYFLTRYILKIIRLVFVNIELGVIHVRGFQATWTWPTYRILRVVVIIFAIVVAYPYIPGSGTTAFQGISIFLGIILSLGSSSFISNVLAGLFVIYRRSVNEGDLIEVRGYLGRVESIVLLETILRTPKNELVSIPNSLLLGSELRNYSRPGPTGGVIISTKVGIGYEESHRKIEAMLLEAVSRTPGLKSDPAPVVLRSELGDFAVVYEVRVSPEKVDTIVKLNSALHENILDVFNERGVQIMTPAYERDPEEPKVAPVDTPNSAATKPT